jgi:hypothetical protein
LTNTTREGVKGDMNESTQSITDDGQKRLRRRKMCKEKGDLFKEEGH